MNCKKSFVGAILLSFLLLSGCQAQQGKETNYFKEYTFASEATGKQIREIESGIAKSIFNISGGVEKTETYSKSVLNEMNQTIEGKAKVLEDKSHKDAFIIEIAGTVKSSRVGNGITIKESTKSESKEWDTTTGFYVVTEKNTVNKITEESARGYKISGTSEEHKASRIKSLVKIPSTSTGTFYVNSNGSYTCISSSVTKSVTGVQWGDTTKEYITTTRKQTVYTITKDYNITSYYSYDELSANRDRDTGEWYDSVKLISYTYSSVKYEYGTKGSTDIKSLTSNAARQKDGIYITSLVRAYNNYINYDSASDTYAVDASTTTEKEINVSMSSNADGTKQITFNSSISYSYNSSIYRGERYIFEIMTISAFGEQLTQTYPILIDQKTIQTYGSYDYILYTSANPGTYLVNLSTNSIYVTIKALFTGNIVTVESCQIGY